MPRVAVKVDGDLLYKLWQEQGEHLIKTLQENSFATEDDGGDYVDSALDCAVTLFDFCRSNDPQACETWLNAEPPGRDADGHYNYGDKDGYINVVVATPYEKSQFSAREKLVPHLGLLAGDGIASAIYDLRPPALGEDDE